MEKRILPNHFEAKKFLETYFILLNGISKDLFANIPITESVDLYNYLPVSLKVEGGSKGCSCFYHIDNFDTGVVTINPRMLYIKTHSNLQKSFRAILLSSISHELGHHFLTSLGLEVFSDYTLHERFSDYFSGVLLRILNGPENKISSAIINKNQISAASDDYLVVGSDVSRVENSKGVVVKYKINHQLKEGDYDAEGYPISVERSNLFDKGFSDGKIDWNFWKEDFLAAGVRLDVEK